MATKVQHLAYNGPNISEIAELQNALNTAQFELNYEKSSRIVEGVAKDEEIRKLKFSIAVMEDQVEELNEQLAKEEERADFLVQDLEEANARGDDFEGDVQVLMGEVRLRERERETAKAEAAALSDISADTTKIIKEKLALARELANLKPELEHLRSQATIHESLLSEKLSLQRQLTSIQVELENSQRTAQKASAKAGKSGEEKESFEARIQDLKTQLEESRNMVKEAKAEMASLKCELAQEKKNSQTAAKEDKRIPDLEEQLASLREELATEKSQHSQAKKDLATEQAKQNKTTSKSAASKAETEGMKKDMATERKERQRLEKALEMEQHAWSSQRSALEDKLASFRAKLKSTKEKLKENEAELEHAREIAAQAAEDRAAAGTKAATNAKRKVPSVDPDAAIGTPGDHATVKRGRKAASNVGDKSTFSITPFLNRTMSLAPNTPDSESDSSRKKRKAPADETMDEHIQASTDTATSPAMKKKSKLSGKKDLKQPKPLAPASSAKQNSKPASKRNKLSIPSLEKVMEESEIEAIKAPTSENVSIAEEQSKDISEPEYKETIKTTTVPTTMVPKLKASKQPRKSLLSFATFTTEPEPAKKLKKNRKLASSSSVGKSLLGGSVLGTEGKTLFDEDDETDKPAAKPIPGRGLGIFAKRSLLGKGKGGGGDRAPLVVAEDGFAFSPLKRDRKAAALAQSMLGN